jgi:hypothetical protein
LFLNPKLLFAFAEKLNFFLCYIIFAARILLNINAAGAVLYLTGTAFGDDAGALFSCHMTEDHR